MTSTEPSPSTAPDAAPAAAPGAAVAGGRRPPHRQSVRGIVYTMLVVGGMAVLLWALFPRTSENMQPAVDVGAAATGISGQLGFAPAVPAVGQGWKATSTSAGPGVDGVMTWRVNYVTPRQSWVSVIQGADPTKRWEGVQVIDGGEKGTVTVDGHTFVVRARPDRDLTGYVLRADGVTTVFVGKASREEIEALIRATPLTAS